MKRITLMCLVTLLQAFAYGQFKTVAESPLFEEPETGHAKLLQLKNGNTVVVHLSARNGIDITIYNPEHKLAGHKHHDPSFGKLKGARVNAIFETNSTIAVLISEVQERMPVLYRLLFDGATGNLEREEKIAEAEKYLFKDVRWIPEFDPVNSFSVSKDPASDNYAIFIRRDKSDRADKNQMEVAVYNGDHQEISRAFYQPAFKYASLNYLDMAVLGDDRVCILGFAYNEIASNDREGQLVMMTLTKSGRRMTSELLDLSDNRIADSAIVRFNPVTKKLMLLGAAHIEDANPQPYAGFLLVIDPFKAKVEQEINLYPAEADVQKKKLYGAKETFTGMPQDLVINDDGSFSVIYEELINEAHTPRDATPYTYYMLDNVAVASFDVNGKMLSASFIPKKQYLKNTAYPSFYIAHRKLSTQHLIQADQYRSFSYLHTKRKLYVLLNDAEQNTHPENGNIVQLRSLAGGQAFSYVTGSPAPERSLFFGPLKKEEKHALAVFNLSDYNNATNTYVTLKLEMTAKERKSRLVWLTPEE
ncbi:hypothetical protein [Chitinophaga sp. CF418]|uniref:hypothetical protein n=1 Tax=Chitinophaga sp. CF418 TaxID=1855287 RepID=UPI0009244943|nr:hypothetical protein [Chitinophaga sp. CF418]SHM77722.1 hypothetical protein SAMN05216311_103218 [Chitinophaga sp. CF418]